jgi:hypothetical protein
MSGPNRRTWHKHRVGHFNVTVQLDSTTETHSVARHQELADIARQLIATMDADRIPTTWAVSDPTHSAATSLIIKSAADHELAILGDANWVGPTAGRTRFARELARRLTQARAAGLEVTSLVPRVAPIGENIDLIVKQHISAVVGLPIPTTNQRSNEPHALHYGVWELPISATLPMKAGWFSSGKRTLSRRIQRTVIETGCFHLVIDASAIAAAGRQEASIARWIIRRVATLRDRGLLQVETLRTTAGRLSNVPATAPQRSILRGAA